MEIWKQLIGFDNPYFISNLGNVKSFSCNREKLIKQSLNTTGYYRVTLYKNNKRVTLMVHRLVAEHFIDNPNNYNIVDHIDGNQLNNNVTNLRWVTQRDNILNENTYPKYRTNIDKFNKDKIKPVYQLDDNRKVIRKFSSSEEAAKFVNCSVNCIRRSCRTEYYKAKGYYWSYSPLGTKLKLNINI